MIEDVTSASSKAEFRNDVQLAQYRTEHNLELAKDFIFTKKAAAGRKSSTELLKYLCESFMAGAPPNRFVFIATYGHGKSHFAVATANYFGRANGSPESDGVLARIKNALQDVSTTGFFESFKRNNKPCLILILRGDEPSDLQTKFFRAVEEALGADGLGGGTRAPFWYTDAARFIEGLLKDAPASKRANQFLEAQQLDLAVLLEKVRAQDASTYEITRDLCLHLYQHAPDFGTGLSLKEGVEWLGNNLVGVDKPYGGILILFDEFSSFVRDYALRIQNRPGAPLQDLLNGVELMRGKVAFVALAQRDPELVAKNLLTGDSLQSLTTQLNRLPKQQHYQLHSSLEEVLAAYLKQAPETWKSLLRNPSFSRSLGQASDLCLDIFLARYGETLGWDIERFQQIVAQGCFPLHPATTALLSSVELESTNNPRSVLGFVTKHLDALRGQPAYADDRPNWILPIALVDYFREMLGEKAWDDFTDALIQAGGPDAPLQQMAVLKAMLLQTAAKVATKGSYDRVIASFAGLDADVVTGQLKTLAATGVIRYEPTRRIYTFWPAGKGANKVDQLLSDKLKGRILDDSVLGALNVTLRAEGLIPNLSVPVPWGHQDDWYAEQYLVSKETLSREALRRLASSALEWKPNGLALSRGLVLWSIAETSDDASWVRDAAADAFPDANVPIVIVTPTMAHPEFAGQLLRLYGLSLFSNSDIAEVGQDQFLAVRQLTLESAKVGFKSLKDHSECEVPAGFKARIQATRVRDLESVLIEVFKMAYNAGPKRWFTQYKSSTARLRNATARVAGYLLSNSLDTPDIFNGDSVSKEVAQQLRTEWSLLASDLRVKRPTASSNVRPAWELLEADFPAGEHSRIAHASITKLLNAPFGFDYNTASLLLAAWLGFNRHDLEVSVNGQLRQIRTLATDLKPKEFVELLATASIRKTDADAVKTQVRQLLTRVDTGVFSRAEAQDAQQMFSQALERDDVDQKPAIQAASSKLAAAMLAAEQYDRAAADVEKQLGVLKSVRELVQLLYSLPKLHRPEAVTPDRPAQGELRSRLLERLRTVTELNCSQYQQLESISHYTRNQEQLQILLKTLTAVQLPEMVTIVESALAELDATKVRLEKQEQDQESLRIIGSVEARGSVTQLNRSISNLQGLEAFSERVKSTADSKLRSLREELKRLDDLRSGIPKRLDQVTDIRALDVLNTEILRNINLFDDAEGSQLMQGYVDRCERVRGMFGQVLTLERETVQSQADAQQIGTALRELLETSREYASKAQAGVISEAIRNVEQNVQTKSEAAGAWLEGCEQALSSEDSSDDALARLNSPPPFLSAAQTTRLQELLDETKRRQQSLQQEAASLAALGAIVARGSLVDIQRQVAVVAGLPAPTAKVRQNIEAKLVDLNRELSRLQEYKDSIPGRLDTVRDLRSLDETQFDLLRHLDLFEGTPIAAELQQQLDRCRQLKQFFNAVESCRRRTIVTPEDVQEVREQLNNLAPHPGCTLSPLQIATIADISTHLETETEKRSRDALRWLESCETAASAGIKDEELLATLRTLPPFLAEEERPRVEAIKLELAKRADCKRMEAASLAILSAISLKGTLSELRGRIATVESLGAPTVPIQEQIDRKLSDLRSELRKLTDLSGEISRRLDSACSATSVEEVQTDILRNVNLYDETSERLELENNLDRCKYLRQLFEMVASCSTTDTIRTPADAKDATEKLEGLNAAEEIRISSQHRLVLSAAIRTVENYVAAQADEAVKWVSECERKVAEGSDAVELNELLKSPRPFLPDAGRLRLEELIKQTSRRIDEDEVSLVLMHFSKIHDAPKRTECLNRLRAIVDES